MAAHGRFIPKNPQKYIGDATKIFFRSSWELIAMKRFDSSPAVLKWASEEISIPYLKPTDGKVHQYFPDFIVIYKGRDGQIVKSVIEVKPLKETIDEAAKSDHDKVALAINKSKWISARAWCAQRGMIFEIMTEKSLFRQVEKTAKVTKPPRKTVAPRKPTGSRPTGRRK